MQVRGKAMGQYSGDLFELMGDILATARLDDKPRFTQMVAETKAGIVHVRYDGATIELLTDCRAAGRYVYTATTPSDFAPSASGTRASTAATVDSSRCRS